MNNRLEFIQNWDELAEKARWSVARLAKLCGVSMRTLERYFAKNGGERPKTSLNERRQRRAIDLLRTGYSVKETGEHLGYAEASTFSREFTKFWGFSPTQVKRATRTPASGVVG